MGSSLEFRVLGPLEVTAAGRPVPVTAPRQRTALAKLLMHANRTVSVGQLTDALWATDPPATATNQISICILALRRALAAGTIEPVIVSQPSGYLLRIPDGAVDLDLVEQRVAQARRDERSGQIHAAVYQLRSALALWRGPVLCGIASPALRPEVTRWEERRFGITERCLTLELGLGRHWDLIGELSAFVADHPLRERPRALLMLALYRTGRQAEALDVYRDARQILTEELGLQPGAELQMMERSVLNQDPRLQLRRPARADSSRPRVPRQPPGRYHRIREVSASQPGGPRRARSRSVRSVPTGDWTTPTGEIPSADGGRIAGHQPGAQRGW